MTIYCDKEGNAHIDISNPHELDLLVSGDVTIYNCDIEQAKQALLKSAGCGGLFDNVIAYSDTPRYSVFIKEKHLLPAPKPTKRSNSLLKLFLMFLGWVVCSCFGIITIAILMHLNIIQEPVLSNVFYWILWSVIGVSYGVFYVKLNKR